MDDELVYSTAGGDLRKKNKSGKKPHPANSSSLKVQIRKEKKGRGGKLVTLIEHLSLDPVALAQLAKQLKQHCGCGGSAKEGTIILQGEKVQQARKFLEEKNLLC